MLGLDEANQFAPVMLGDRQALRQGLVGRARACVPPVALEFFDEEVSGSPVVVTRVAECDPSAKPCRDGVSGRAWTRGGDGDYQMSPLEEQAFLAARQPALFDRLPVESATFQDLDPQLLSTWERLVHERDPAGLGRFQGSDLLVRSGVLTGDGVPTKAGVLTLGLHPQQFFPRFVVNLASTAPGVRVAAPETVSGPIPRMLESALDWARRVFRVDVVGGSDGTVRDVYEYPLEAFRELVGNALVHRDLDAWSEGMAIEVRHLPDRLVVTNPGGLYGITVDRLGRPGTTSAPNGRLIELCRYARTSDGGRVVETLASGIPRVLETLELRRTPVAALHRHRHQVHRGAAPPRPSGETGKTWSRERRPVRARGNRTPGLPSDRGAAGRQFGGRPGEADRAPGAEHPSSAPVTGRQGLRRDTRGTGPTDDLPPTVPPLATSGPPIGAHRSSRRCFMKEQHPQAGDPQVPLNAVVREGGVEPPRPFGHTDLNRARLPIPPLAPEAC